MAHRRFGQVGSLGVGKFAVSGDPEVESSDQPSRLCILIACNLQTNAADGGDEVQLRRVLKNYASDYNQVRTHLSLRKDAPYFRRPQKLGRVAAIPILGGLHHQYVRV
jgi:hypothetical protein